MSELTPILSQSPKNLREFTASAGLGEAFVVALWQSHDWTLLHAHCSANIQDSPQQPQTLLSGLNLSYHSVRGTCIEVGQVNKVIDHQDCHRILTQVTAHNQDIGDESHPCRSSPYFCDPVMANEGSERLPSVLNDLTDYSHLILTTPKSPTIAQTSD